MSWWKCRGCAELQMRRELELGVVEAQQSLAQGEISRLRSVISDLQEELQKAHERHGAERQDLLNRIMELTAPKVPSAPRAVAAQSKHNGRALNFPTQSPAPRPSVANPIASPVPPMIFGEGKE